MVSKKTSAGERMTEPAGQSAKGEDLFAAAPQLLTFSAWPARPVAGEADDDYQPVHQEAVSLTP